VILAHAVVVLAHAVVVLAHTAVVRCAPFFARVRRVASTAHAQFAVWACSCSWRASAARSLAVAAGR
jgi:hypothetical protein